MINRLRRRRREPSSIFEHIDAHVLPDVPGLSEGGDDLPDDEIFADGEIPFAPGALEGIFGGPDDSEFGRAAVERIYDALVALAADPSPETRSALRDAFREGYVRARIDPLRERLGESPPPHAELLYPELREIFFRSGHRDEVKYAMALMSGFRRPEDADPLRIVGRHAEFTLYAAVALATVTDDPLAEWLALLPHVTGWGRTELAGLILREPRSRDVREQVVREGLGIGNALVLAVECRLDELLARPDVDDEVLAGGQEIIGELIDDDGVSYRLTDYPDAGPAVEALLTRLAERPDAPAAARTAGEVAQALREGAGAEAAGDGEGRLEAAGFDAERLARVRALCERLGG